MQILKAKKEIDNLAFFFALLGSIHIKAAGRMLMKLTPGGNPVKGERVSYFYFITLLKFRLYNKSITKCSLT